MKVLLLNQYGPASGAPTGRILGELADGLRARGHEAVLVESDPVYGVSRRGLRRIRHELRAHLLLLARSLAVGRVDAVISLTSPACLAVTAGIIARLLGARHYHWAMDLYPDVGVLLGELPNGAPIRLLEGLMRRSYRRAARVIALDDDMRDYLREHYGVESGVMEPFPPQVTWPEPASDPGAPKRWCYSGNFGRAHEIEVLLRAQKRLEDSGVPAELVLQGKGAQFDASRDAAQQLGVQRVEWRPPVPQAELGASLLAVDLLVVTRKANMKGLLLPSKLMLAELSGRPVLWIGDTDGHTAARLRRNGHGVFAFDEVEPIAAWLQALFTGKLGAMSKPPRPTQACRDEAVAQWVHLLAGSNQP
jgi:glycosyltransferase involved in cell wall biosynthesis